MGGSYLDPPRLVQAAFAILVGMALGFLPQSARASTLCVNSARSGGCYATVQAAINAVSAPNSTILVQRGTYRASCGGPACSVAMISADAANGKSLTGLSLVCGNGRGPSAVLNAANLDHAVYINGVNQVTVENCVAINAAREGILVENADDVHVVNNDVEDNDRAMAATFGKGNPPCPTFLSPGTPGTEAIQCCPDAFKGGPGNFPEDNDDCGEGMHLRGVINSVVEGNYVHENIGGILLSDETGPNENNLVTANNSSDNLQFGGDCGITLASHLACASGSNDKTGCLPSAVNGVQANGVFHNAVIGNELEHNGASGTGMFANPGIPPGSATKVYGNLVSGNTIENNGQPGIAIHVHAANGNADYNTILSNVLSDNGGDSEAEGNSPPDTAIEVLSNGAFPGFGPAAPIVGTTISQNKIFDEDIDVWVGNTATAANVFLNNLYDQGAIGVDNAGTAIVTATDNWWGCPAGPGAPGCSTTSGDVISSPFLTHPVQP